MAMTTKRALKLLGGGANGHDLPNGHDLLAGHASRSNMTVVTRPRRGWSWFQRDQRGERPRRQARPGGCMIMTALVLLFALGIGLMAVSYAAQYRYVLAQRGQVTASIIEAGALDVGLCILSLLALGLSRRGLPSGVERVLIVAVAAASAGMNFAAAAHATSWRQVAAFVMPPVFLAAVVDRCVSVIRRHVLGMQDTSPWAVAARAVRRVFRFGVMMALYTLRLTVDRRGTLAGIRQAILNATPLPAARQGADGQEKGKPRPGRRSVRAASGTKTARFLELVRTRHGELAALPLDQVSKIATAIAAEADLHPASARTALLGAVRAALPAGEGDVK
jgi:hypothetical protein